jgi:hypothetical protein
MLRRMKGTIMITLFLLINITLVSCQKDKGVAPELEATADYILTFESTWSSETHPTNFPSNPHFSGLIGAIHDKNIVFWEEGKPASIGIKEMAEKGLKDSLQHEVSQAIQMNYASIVLSGGGIASSPGSVSLSFQMSSDFPLVTIVSMLAPSPDWFVGVSALDLTENGKWIENKTVDLYVYDAGTDSGSEYTSPNQITSPPENIAKIMVPPFKIGDTIPPVGSFTFTRERR